MSDKKIPSILKLDAKPKVPQIPGSDVRRYNRLTGKTQAGLASDSGTSSIYPFTKRQELTNDGLGFGEQVTESRVNQRASQLETLNFRRTRSGKVRYVPEKERPFMLSLRGREG